jgi:hypothetical protein
MKSKDGCIKTSSNCVIWEGPDIPCLKLCNGDTITEVLYKLAIKFCDTLVMLDPTKYDISCFNDISCPPTDFSELFQLVIDQICNIQLLPGPPGVRGTNGAAGINGNYITVSRVLSGSIHCPCGGVQIDYFDGISDTLISTSFACNGCAGTPGATGATGTPGPIGPPGIQGLPGNSGAEGKSGRGVAVFVQTIEPTQSDFDSIYGSIEGFGVNYIGVNNTIRPGDLWIQPCTPL